MNGREWRDWSPRRALPQLPPSKAGKLALTIRDGHATVLFAPVAAQGALQVEMALLGGALQSDVLRGENKGRNLQHDFAVLQIFSKSLRQEHDLFSADVPLHLSASSPATAIAAWISIGDGQPVIQAVGGWLSSDEVGAAWHRQVGGKASVLSMDEDSRWTRRNRGSDYHGSDRHDRTAR